MKVKEMPKDFSVIFKYGNRNIVVADKLRYNTPVINLNSRHLNKIYLNRIGFKPMKTQRGTLTKEVEIRHDGMVQVSDVCVYDRHSRGVDARGEIGTLEEVFPIQEVFADFDFVLSEKGKIASGQDAIIVTKYNVKMATSEEVIVREVDTFWISFETGTGVKVGKDVSEVKIEELKDFFKDVVDGDESWYYYMPEIIFDGFSEEYGFMDIYEEYKQVLRQTPRLSTYELLRYFYYLGQRKYYFLCEYLIKNNMVNKVSELNPVFTGEDIPAPKDIFVLSKTSMEIVQASRGDKDLIDALTKCEKDTKIGVNGVKIIYEVMQAYKKVDEWDTPFRAYRYDDIFDMVYDIVNTFDITPKVLMEKCIRASFYENLEPMGYLRLILDYVQMSKQLGIAIEKKLPQDVTRRHDLLQSQIVYIQNMQVEKLFKAQTKMNEKLLALAPVSSDFMLVCPQTPNDLIQEGLEMNHCVGSYVGRVAEGYSKIFFLRNTKTPNIPLVTIELNKNNLLVQAKASSNATPNKSIMAFIDAWIQEINKNKTI